MPFPLSRISSAIAFSVASFIALPTAMAQDIVQDAGAAPLVATSASLPELREIGRLKKVFRHEKLRQNIPPEDQSHFLVRAFMEQENAEPVRLWVGEGEARQEIPLGEKGELTWRPSKELFAANPPVFTDVPDNQLTLSLRMKPVIPINKTGEGDIIQAADLRLSTSQINKAIGKAAGLVSFMVPKMKVIVIKAKVGEVPILHFENGETQEMVLADTGVYRTAEYYQFDTKSRKMRKVTHISANDITDIAYYFE
jgi:hypothetical protein